jgi:uncharacterized membrane protein
VRDPPRRRPTLTASGRPTSDGNGRRTAMYGTVYLAYDYPVLGAFWTVMWIFLWVMWFLLLFRVIVDIFRDHEMSGWAKAAWLLFVLVIPFLGVLVYVIARGKDMGKREIQQAREQQEAMNAYIRQTAKGAGTGDDLAKLSELKTKGDLTEEEFQRAKAKLLS